MESSGATLWTDQFPIEGVSGYFLFLRCFVEIHVFNVNSVDTYQMQHSAAFDLGLHCFSLSHLWDARHKWVKFEQGYFAI